ncbi:MAG: response regulator [Candidatus Brocadiaceae bacterium]|nr:response regulator [Candidatus Brocadiaceae bacterium]
MENNNEVEILLVEDIPTDAELCIRALEKRNFTNKLVWVKDGEEALDFIFSTGKYAGSNKINCPNVILLDIKLPKVDGNEVFRRIKSDERTKKIPVVVLTSSKEDRDVAESYNLGVNSYISKPVEWEEITKVVSALGFYWLLLNKRTY